MFATTYQRVSDSWAMCSSGTGRTLTELRERARKARKQAATSKSGPAWGPSHSFDTEDVTTDQQKNSWWTSPGAPTDLKRSPGTNSTKSSDSSPKGSPPPTDSVPPKISPWTSPFSYCHHDTTLEGQIEMKRGKKSLMEYVEDVCSPFHPRNLAQTDFIKNVGEPALGISRMEPPTNSCNIDTNASINASSKAQEGNGSSVGHGTSVTSETPADRRRQRHIKRQQRGVAASVSDTAPHEDFEVTTSQIMAVPPKIDDPSLNHSLDESNQGKVAPLDSFTLDRQTAVELERSISELTMRSSYGVATAKLSENRRMAYYAVGKHHRQSGRGGNRRCYFTGKLILSGSPFYAGSVQQGLRTLVVFCLPSSLGLPKGVDAAARDNASVLASIEGASVAASRVSAAPSRGARSILSSRRSAKLLPSRSSYADEMSLSVGEELDPNWGLDKDYLLSVLPAANQEILDELARRFPEQFETLPVQVRNPSCWRLYVKFCFFSGLPIAEGELHYKVRDEVADNFGEEVILSHEVMEAVNGHDSAEILRLPNLKTFRYLRKHYNQQSAKLPDEVFQRKAWELVRPEV